ncbi:MAG TPA: response regulator [Vicinamibacterales bacterium]|nr:response regulator [Vicinamibacterales bacterium]
MLADNHMADANRSAPHELKPAKQGFRILVVDDNHDSALSLAMMLSIMGHETHTAHDGESAVATAESFLPDVVLLDIGLPKLNGYEVAHRIRERAWGASMFLIAVTGWGQEEDRQRSSEVGLNVHMVKPVEPSALEKLLSELARDGRGPSAA